MTGSARPARAVLAGAGGALALKAAGACAAFVMFAVTARTLDAEAFGRLGIWFNAMSFLAVVALCGQETLILKVWATGTGACRHSLMRFALSNTIAAALGLFAVALTIALAIGHAPRPSLAAAGGAFLLAQAVLHLTSHASRVAVGLRAAEGHREVAWRLAVATAAVVCLAGGRPLLPEAFLALAALCMIGSTAWQWRRLASRLRDRAGPAPADRRGWRRQMGGMWLAAILDAGNQYLDVVLIGLLLDPSAAAGYFAAARIAAVFPILAGGLANYAAAEIAGLFPAGQRQRLQSLLARLQSLAAVGAIAGLVIVAVWGAALLAIFGDGYRDFAPVLHVLALGAAVSLLAGPAPHLLLLCGLERAYPMAGIAALVLRMVLVLVLSSTFGAVGAAAAAAFAASVQAVVLNRLCRRRLGIDPSVVALLRRANR
ncbi:O-antigen/teichoic acid export membrane protein [Chelatococcus caeni]|uniref:O-antigen/teichoic acid export membrane protein n=1 Tax=Chelatococcus caeni TaxID=1348468 RepID=A0A840BZV1_9HYPH|nr:polysaccharide biosynthesis C-terminal domain-containing protein [Chelatococcus caeni]MBB4018714.1 O-antigen/teichoic acid export membrane protein [Chelatococcus caeni]